MKRVIAAVSLFWLCLVGYSLWWNLAEENKSSENLAFETARAFFQQILITRAWNAEHGGVYVPVTESVYPNPYLDDPLRDIVTDKGMRLTKINPAYMTRQIADIAARGSGIQFHITSLKPIRPQNKPTRWEEVWLKEFENGVGEKGEFVEYGGTNIFRYMAPLFVEESCLQCHAGQGYRTGDVRGGISITLPHLFREDNSVLFLGYGIIAVAGVILTIIGGSLLAREKEQLVQTNQTLEKEIAKRGKLIKKLQDANEQINTLTDIIPICMYCKEIRDDKGFWNRVEKYIAKQPEAQFSHGICPKCMKERYPDILLEQEQGDGKITGGTAIHEGRTGGKEKGIDRLPCPKREYSFPDSSAGQGTGRRRSPC